MFFIEKLGVLSLTFIHFNMQHCIEDNHICYHLHRQETGIASGLGVPFPTSDDGGCYMIRLVFDTLI